MLLLQIGDLHFSLKYSGGLLRILEKKYIPNLKICLKTVFPNLITKYDTAVPKLSEKHQTGNNC